MTITTTQSWILLEERQWTVRLSVRRQVLRDPLPAVVVATPVMAWSLLQLCRVGMVSYELIDVILQILTIGRCYFTNSDEADGGAADRGGPRRPLRVAAVVAAGPNCSGGGAAAEPSRQRTIRFIGDGECHRAWMPRYTAGPRKEDPLHRSTGTKAKGNNRLAEYRPDAGAVTAAQGRS